MNDIITKESVKALGIFFILAMFFTVVFVVYERTNRGQKTVGAGPQIHALNHQPSQARKQRFRGQLPRQFEVVRLLNEETAYVRDQNGACFLAYITWGGGRYTKMTTEYASVDSKYCPQR